MDTPNLPDVRRCFKCHSAILTPEKDRPRRGMPTVRYWVDSVHGLREVCWDCLRETNIGRTRSFFERRPLQDR